MSNPTMAMRIDYQPIDIEILGKVASAEFGSPDASQSLLRKGHYTTRVEGSYVTIRLLGHNRCLSIEPRGEPGWTTMFNICRAYSSDGEIRMALGDEEHTHFVCVDVESTVEEVYQKMRDDPIEAERIMKEMGIGD